jgi:predicted small lipoprotein YifL
MKVREIPETNVPRPNRSLISLATIGALTLALPLAACGRKGPLDPPPGGYALERSTTSTPVTDRGVQTQRRGSVEYDESGRPIAPEGSRRRTPADWLID